MNKNALKYGYIVLFAITVINLNIKILAFLASTHFYMIFSEAFEQILDLAACLSAMHIPLIIAFVVSTIVLLAYRKLFPKITVVLVLLMLLYELLLLFIELFVPDVSLLLSAIIFFLFIFIYPLAIIYMAVGVGSLSKRLKE